MAEFLDEASTLDKEHCTSNPARMKTRFFRFVFLFSIFGVIPSVVHAHILPGQASGFTGGFQHPLFGLDHILAMIAVGLWAFQLGGRAVWFVPLTFVSIMAVGGVFGMSGLHVPFVEEGILLSVLILGILIAAAARFPLAVSMAIVGLFALFHGHSHGTEMPLNASGFGYGVGFVLATALLHGCGIGLGAVIVQSTSPKIVRYAGAAVVAGGLYLCIS